MKIHFAFSILLFLLLIPVCGTAQKHDSLIQHQTNPQIIFHGPRNRELIALTFDACATGSGSRYDSVLINILIKTKTPATLFLSGRWVKDHLTETIFLSEQSLFEIGNHSYIHPHLRTKTPVQILSDLKRTQEILTRTTGKTPQFFRAPYGELNDTIVLAASQLGMRTIQYDLPSGDPDSSALADKLVNYVGSVAKNGSIIVMHMNKRGWHTAEALPQIIERLRKRGFKFVTMSELLR